MAIGHLSGLLQLLDAATGQLLSTNLYPRSRAVALFAPRGDLLAVAAGRDSPQIEIRHSHSMAILQVLEPPAFTQKLAFSACGRFLAALGQAGTISVWEVAAWDLVASLDGGPLGVLLWSGGIDFAPEGRMLASGDFEGHVCLWDVETGERIASFQAHADPIHTLAFSPDGRTIASASGPVGKTIRLWEVASGALLDELAWLRLVGSGREHWENRSHFFAADAEAMRRILIDRARSKSSARHGGQQKRVELDRVRVAMEDTDEAVLAVHEALDRLAAVHPVKAEVVKLRYFVGMNHNQIAQALGFSEATVRRHWTFARAWLYADMKAHLAQ